MAFIDKEASIDLTRQKKFFIFIVPMFDFDGIKIAQNTVYYTKHSWTKSNSINHIIIN